MHASGSTLLYNHFTCDNTAHRGIKHWLERNSRIKMIHNLIIQTRLTEILNYATSSVPILSLFCCNRSAGASFSLRAYQETDLITKVEGLEEHLQKRLPSILGQITLDDGFLAHLVKNKAISKSAINNIEVNIYRTYLSMHQ